MTNERCMREALPHLVPEPLPRVGTAPARDGRAGWLIAVARQVRADEWLLLTAVALGKQWPRDAASRLDIHANRAAYLYEKWATRGWYEWGTFISLGWVTPKGRNEWLIMLGARLALGLVAGIGDCRVHHPTGGGGRVARRGAPGA